MRSSGWRGLAEAAARVAGAGLSVCRHLRQGSWPAAMWVDPALAPLLRGWQPAPWPGTEPLVAQVLRGRLVLGEGLQGLGKLPAAVERELGTRLRASALLSLELLGRPPAMLWLGFGELPARDRLLAIADLIESVSSRLLSREQLFLDEAPLVFVSVDLDGVIRQCNTAVEQLGYRPEELVGQPAETIYAPGERERLLGSIPRTGLVHRQVMVRHRSGEAVPVDLLVGLIHDDDGELLESIGVGRDLRPDRRLEHHHRLEAVSRLISGIAHELNNPLLTVVGNAEMLAGMKLAVAARRRAERVLAGARRCREVVEGLLRLRVKRKQLEEVVDLEVVLRQALRSGAPARESHVELSLCGEALQVRGDPSDLEHAIAQLVRNALQAVEGRPRPRVQVSLIRDNELACISVRDNGPGMTPEVQGRAFEPFFTTRDVGQGRGLGLSIAMGIVQDHAGYIELRSDAEGTVAAIRLPLLSPQAGL